jgi:diguanylate cyclase (GGDEF)-like protein
LPGFERWLVAVFVLGVAWVQSSAAAVASPTTRLSFRSYGREQGLRNITVSQLIQDRQGFLWAGTDDGLYRYDGSRFQLFGANEGLKSTLVNVLHLDAGGNIWVGTEQGLAHLDNGVFHMANRGLPEQSVIADLANGPDGELWIGTSAGIYAGSHEKGFREIAAWGKDPVYALCSSSGGRVVWVAGRSNLWRIEQSGALKVVDEGGKAGIEGIERLLADGYGNLWVRSAAGLYVLKNGEALLRPVEGLLRSESRQSRMLLDASGKLWYPNEKGVACLENGRWSQIGLAEGLPIDFARATLVDHEGSLWVGGHGLFRVLGRGLWRSAGPAENLPVPVWSIRRDRARTLWVGTERGLTHHTPTGWEVVKGTESFCLRSVEESPDGFMYLAGEPARVLRFDRESRQVTLLPELPVKERRILKLLADTDGTLWIGTRSAGLLRGRQTEGRWRYESVVLPGGTDDERIAHILRDRHGRLWVAGSKGLACYSDGRWTRFNQKNGLIGEAVLYLAETPTGDLWVSYLDPVGLSKVRLEGVRFSVVKNLGAEQGLASLEIYLVALDSKGRLWLGSNKGVDIIDQPDSDRPAVWHHGIEDGLVDEDTDAMAILCEPDGDVWVGTRGGLGQFAGSRYTGPPAPPETAILKARLGSIRLSPASSQETRVSHRDNTLEVRFAGLSFANEAALQQQVRLEGLEHEWVSLETREIRYSGLAHGRYRLLLRSRIGQGSWGPEEGLAFEIRSPWWSTSWFRLFASLALGCLAYVAIRWRLRALTRRNEELTRQVEARTRDLARRTEELEIANEALEGLSLTDALTGLKNRRFLNVTIGEDVARANRNHRDVTGSKKERALLNIDLIFIMVDLDHFKKVNDDYGHAAGDRVLQQFAAILGKATRESDTSVRWGGEEFLVVARNACRNDAAILLERIRSRVESYPFDVGEGLVIRCTCSLGFTFYPFLPDAREVISWEQAIELSDRCLYAAKRGGRNAWVGIFPTIDADPSRLRQFPPSQVEQLIREGILQVRTSLPGGGELDWRKAEPDGR